MTDDTEPTGDGTVSQIEVFCAIRAHLDARGVKYLNTRQMNAVIKAADLVVGALAKPTVPATTGMGLAAWLASDDTGQSSLYVARALAPAAGLGECHTPIDSAEPWPHDPADFGRVVRLLDAVPELRPHIGLLAAPEHGPVWNRIAAEWDTLESLYRTDLPTGRCERLYLRLQELKAGA